MYLDMGALLVDRHSGVEQTAPSRYAAQAFVSFEDDVAEVAHLLDEWAARRGPLFTVGPAEPARVGDLDPDGWGEWRMLPSAVHPHQVDALERELGVRLPPFYRAFLCCRALLDLDFGEYTLPPLPCGDPLRDVRAHLRARSGAGYIPFGSARGCGDPLCFDTLGPGQDGDCPVVVFNHDVVPPGAWADRDVLQRYAAVVAPSFRVFLRALLSGDAATLPSPQSPEEIRRNEAWSRVQGLLRERGLPPNYRPAGIDPADPWAIARALERAG